MTLEAASKIDLHTHSTASDGVLSPTSLVELASHSNVEALALTDHDSTEGVAEAVDAGSRLGVDVIPGVELGTDVAPGELHMLGYFIDHHHRELQRTLATFRSDRLSRAERMVERLQDAGLRLDLAEVRRLADGAITRAHVARALVDSRQVASIEEAFTLYLAPGQPGYIPRSRLSPHDAITLIRSAGGVAVLAHPFSVPDLETLLPELIAAGLAGMEAYYGPYTVREREQLFALASELDLIPTGGSDFHGPGVRDSRPLASVAVPRSSLERLRQAADRVR